MTTINKEESERTSRHIEDIFRGKYGRNNEHNHGSKETEI
jgi:hypothetical protein